MRCFPGQTLFASSSQHSVLRPVQTEEIFISTSTFGVTSSMRLTAAQEPAFILDSHTFSRNQHHALSDFAAESGAWIHTQAHHRVSDRSTDFPADLTRDNAYFPISQAISENSHHHQNWNHQALINQRVGPVIDEGGLIIQCQFVPVNYPVIGSFAIESPTPNEETDPYIFVPNKCSNILPCR